MLHLTRKTIADPCDVCGVETFKPCIGPGLHDDESVPKSQMELHLGDDRDEVAWTEFQLIGAARRLRQLRPNHPLAMVIMGLIALLESEIPPPPGDSDQ